MNSKESPVRFAIESSPTEAEMKIIKKGLEEYNKKHPNGDLDIPTPDISLVLRNKNGEIVGGVITSMLTGVMHLEVLWVDKKYRGLGLGKRLVLETERIAKKCGCISGQAWVLSFQTLEFFQRLGYEVFGVSEDYPEPTKEYYLIKKY